MTWDEQDRRSGKDQRQAERRGVVSQRIMKTIGVTNRRKQMRRAADREALAAGPERDNKWRELRLRTVGTAPVAKLSKQKSKLRLVRNDDNKKTD